MNDTNTEADAIANLSPRAEYVVAGGAIQPVLVVPNHSKQFDLSHLEARPKRAKIHASIISITQLHAYILANKGERPVVFADRNVRKFDAFMNWHKDGSTPSWLDHTACHQMELSKQANIWIAAQKTNFTQDLFGDFLEDNDADLQTQEMHNVAANFQAIRTETFRSSRRKDNGDFEMTHSATTANGGDKIITVPPEFQIAIPLFSGDKEKTLLRCLLRHRVADGAVRFTFKIHQLDRLLDQVFDETVATLRATECAEVFEGSQSSTPISKLV